MATVTLTHPLVMPLCIINAAQKHTKALVKLSYWMDAAKVSMCLMISQVINIISLSANGLSSELTRVNMKVSLCKIQTWVNTRNLKASFTLRTSIWAVWIKTLAIAIINKTQTYLKMCYSAFLKLSKKSNNFHKIIFSEIRWSGKLIRCLDPDLHLASNWHTSEWPLT